MRVPAGSKYSDQTGQIQTTSQSSIVYFTPLGDIRIFDGENDLIISHPLRDTLQAFNYAQRAKIWCLHDSQNDQIMWFFPSGTSTEPDTAAAWNYRYGVWYAWTPQPFGHGCELDTPTDASVLLTGEANTSTGGYVYAYFTGNDFNGAAIDSKWMTKTLYGINEQGQPSLSTRKRWRWVDLLFRINQNVTLTMEWLQGSSPDNASAIASTTMSPGSQTLITMDGSTILTGDGSSILLAKQSAQVKALLHDDSGNYLHDEGMRLRIGTNSTTGGWALEAMQVAYQILPGLKRRDQ